MLDFKFLLVFLTAICLLPNFGLSNEIDYDIPLFPITTKAFRRYECESAIETVNKEERENIVDEVPILSGTWASDGCEIRRGPEFIVRHLSFSDNLKFEYHIFHYKESSCTTPLFSIISEGTAYVNTTKNIKMTKKPTIEKLAMVIYDTKKISNHQKSVRQIMKKCPLFQGPHFFNEEHNILENGYNSTFCEDVYDDVIGDFSFFQTQLRPISGRKVRELLTSYPKDHDSSVFDPPLNPPLIWCGQRHSGKACHSTVQSPPVFMPTPPVPILLTGDWISRRCEDVGNGFYIYRKTSFRSKSWRQQTTFFSGPSCQDVRYTEVRDGTFELGKPSKVIDGATEMNFWVPLPNRDMSVLPQIIKYEERLSLVRVEIDAGGSLFLSIGENPEDGMRSTSFLPSLYQCSSYPGSTF